MAKIGAESKQEISTWEEALEKFPDLSLFKSRKAVEDYIAKYQDVPLSVLELYDTAHPESESEAHEEKHAEKHEASHLPHTDEDHERHMIKADGTKADYVDEDERYHSIYERKKEAWLDTHKNATPEEKAAFFTTIIENPKDPLDKLCAISSTRSVIEQDILEEMRKFAPKTLKKYAEAEKTRVYTRPEDDPAYREALLSAKEKTRLIYEKAKADNTPLDDAALATLFVTNQLQALNEFGKNYPAKVKSYIKSGDFVLLKAISLQHEANAADANEMIRLQKQKAAKKELSPDEKRTAALDAIEKRISSLQEKSRGGKSELPLPEYQTLLAARATLTEAEDVDKAIKQIYKQLDTIKTTEGKPVEVANTFTQNPLKKVTTIPSSETIEENELSDEELDELEEEELEDELAEIAALDEAEIAEEEALAAEEDDQEGKQGMKLPENNPYLGSSGPEDEGNMGMDEESERQSRGPDVQGMQDKLNQAQKMLKKGGGGEAGAGAAEAGGAAAEATGAAEGMSAAASAAGAAQGAAAATTAATTAGGAAAAGAGTAAASGAAAAGTTAAAAGATAGAPVIIIIIIVVVILLLLLIIILWLGGALGGMSNDDAAITIPPVSITKSGPSKVNNGENISYDINVSFPGSAQDVMVQEQIPDGSSLVSATGKYTVQGNKIVWSLKENQSSASGPTPTGPIVTTEKYTQTPYNFPAPDRNAAGTTYSADDFAKLNALGNRVARYQNYILSRVKNKDPRYADPFLTVIWSGAIEGIRGNNYFYNCRDASNNINAGCAGGFSSGNWQVSYGVQVSEAAPNLASYFDAAYGLNSSGTASKVQAVGQKVIADSGGKITNPATFPAVTIPDLVTNAKKANDPAAQQAIAILLMDPDIGAIATAVAVGGNIASQDNWVETMKGWDRPQGSCGYYCKNIQIFSNRMQVIADGYSGATGGMFKPQTFTVVLKPEKDDIYLINQATANVIGARADNSPTTAN